MGLVGQPEHVVHCVGLGERQAVVVVVTIYIIRVDAVAAFGDRDVEAGGHDIADWGRGDIEPVFAGPAVEFFALGGSGECG